MEQKAIIIGFQLDNNTEFYYSMEELANLADACDIEVVGELTQKLDRIHPTHYFGAGKIEELRLAVDQNDANLVICNDELSPSQLRNLERELEVKIVDRTILILDIFGARAKTKEAQLQVEVAELQYMLPRLVGLRASLGRQGGGVGLANRGSGEKKIELDRRRIEDKIALLNRELEHIVNHRHTQRKQRKKNELPVVSIVGYTNAGKSTLMNAAVDRFSEDKKHVFEKDMLFATLDTSVRKISFPDNKTFLLSDTVGFVSKLPHHLVRAFRSTLEEVIEADLLLHVVDFSQPEYLQMIDITNQVLSELGADNIPTIYVYNKCDLVQSEIPKIEGNNIYLSAKSQIGIEELMDMIRKEIFKNYRQVRFQIPFSEGQIVSYFNDYAHVISTDYNATGSEILVECKLSDIEKYKQYLL